MDNSVETASDVAYSVFPTSRFAMGTKTASMVLTNTTIVVLQEKICLQILCCSLLFTIYLILQTIPSHAIN